LTVLDKFIKNLTENLLTDGLEKCYTKQVASRTKGSGGGNDLTRFVQQIDGRSDAAAPNLHE
jgi:hypothetical protein